MKNILQKFELDTKKIILILSVAAVLAYLDYSYVLMAQSRNIKVVNSKILDIKQNIARFYKDSADIEKMKHKQQDAGISGITKIKKLVSNEGIPLLLKEISDLANDNQVRIMQIKPEKEKTNVKTAKAMGAQDLSGGIINLEVSCDYHRLGQFLNAIENSEVFIAIEEIKIASMPNDYFRQNVKLQLKTYVRD